MSAAMIPTTFLLVVLSVCFLSVEGCPPWSSETPPMNETMHLQQLSAGLQVLNKIAVKKLTTTVQFPGSNLPLNITNLKLHFTHAGQTLIANPLELLCEQHDLVSSLWDYPVARFDAELTFIRTSFQLLEKQTCKWVEHLLEQEYPRSNISFTCTARELDRICHDYQTATFSSTLQDSVHTYDAATRDPDASRWIDQNVADNQVLPEVYHVINGTREEISSS